MKLQLTKGQMIGGAVVLALILAGLIYYFSLPQVEAVKAEKGAISQIVEETGYVRAGEFYDIQAPITGRVLAINAANSQEMAAGQIILTLQNLDLDAQLAKVNQEIAAAEANIRNGRNDLDSARMELTEAQKTVQRNGSLKESGAISQSDFDAANTAAQKLSNSVASLEASLAGYESSLKALQDQQTSLSQQEKQLVIASPINATVLSLPVKRGQLVQAGTVLATVGTPGRLEVTSDILCDDIPAIQPGQKAIVSFAGQELPARVKEIYPQAFEKMSALGVSQRLVPVVATLDDNGPLKPGYEVQMAIETARNDQAMLLPREAIISGTGGTDTVRLVSSGRIRIVPVKTGIKNQQQIEILDGVKEGDLVIRDGSSHLTDGAGVRALTAAKQ